MGGLGSGRISYSMKTTVDECRVIDVHELNSEGYIEPGHGGTSTWSKNGDEVASIGWRVTGDEDRPRLRLKYAVTTRGGDEHRVNYSVPIVYTECNFGGERPWFQCPGRRRDGCGERVGKLYKPPGQLRFLCRHCYDLAYESSTRQGSFYFETLGKPSDRLQEAKQQLREDGFSRENFQELYEAKKEVREGVQTISGERISPLLPETPVEIEPLPPFEEWLEDIQRRIYNELYGRDYGEYGQCEATARSTGERCRQPAIGEHGKCHYHGGAPGSGAPEGNQNAAADVAD